MASAINEISQVTPERVKNLLHSFIAVDDVVSYESSFNESADTSITSDVGSRSFTPHHDKEAYFERVYSFTTLYWCAKPAELSPLICARFGWMNTDVDMLQCVDCRAAICATLPTHNSKAYADTVQVLKASLLTSHEVGCCWKSNPSSQKFCSLPNNKADLQESILIRLTSLLECCLPPLDFTTLQSHGIEEDTLKASLSEVSGENDADCRSLIFALFGWQQSDSNSVIACELCGRSVGLWNFKSYVPSSKTDDASSNDITSTSGVIFCNGAISSEHNVIDNAGNMDSTDKLTEQETIAIDKQVVCDVAIDAKICDDSNITENVSSNTLGVKNDISESTMNLNSENKNSNSNISTDVVKDNSNSNIDDDDDEIQFKVQSETENNNAENVTKIENTDGRFNYLECNDKNDSLSDITAQSTNEIETESRKNNDESENLRGEKRAAEDEIGESDKRLKVMELTDFDPICEHKYWCPWLTPSKLRRSQSRSVSHTPTTNEKAGTINGWQRVLQVLGVLESNIPTPVQLRQSPQVEGLRSLRCMLRQWASNKSPRSK